MFSERPLRRRSGGLAEIHAAANIPAGHSPRTATSRPAPSLSATAPAMTPERAVATVEAIRAGATREAKAKAITGLSAAVDREISKRQPQHSAEIDRALRVDAADSPRLGLAKATARAVRRKFGDEIAAPAIERVRVLAR